jgi:hypothetical protein
MINTVKDPRDIKRVVLSHTDSLESSLYPNLCQILSYLLA